MSHPARWMISHYRSLTKGPKFPPDTNRRLAAGSRAADALRIDSFDGSPRIAAISVGPITAESACRPASRPRATEYRSERGSGAVDATHTILPEFRGGVQPPIMLNLLLSKPAESHSLHRLVGSFSFVLPML